MTDSGQGFRVGVIATDMTGGVKEKYDKLIIHDERGITPIRPWGKPEDIGFHLPRL